MSDELAAGTPTGYKIEILGVSWSNRGFNSLMTQGRDLPWLQDTSGGDVTADWGAAWRDFVILDPANGRPLAAYNLSSNSLDIVENYNELKAILTGLAALKDQDGDGLSDYYEEEMSEGDLSRDPTDDNDRDRATVLLEYGLGSRDDNPGDLPHLGTGIMAMGADRYHTISFRRRLGAAGGLGYAVEFDRDLSDWTGNPGDIVEVDRMNPYDGTGTEIVTVRSVQPISAGDSGQLRVRVTAPPAEPSS